MAGVVRIVCVVEGGEIRSAGSSLKDFFLNFFKLHLDCSKRFKKNTRRNFLNLYFPMPKKCRCTQRDDDNDVCRKLSRFRIR